MNRFASRALALVALVCPLFAANENSATYLALGDSVAFGLDLTLLPPFVKVPAPPDSHAGYPEVFAAAVPTYKALLNAACPGETSGSFIEAGAPDNGCLAFKLGIGLRAHYQGTQLAYATSVLAKNKKIRLVTLGLGGNDLLLLQQECTDGGQLSDACVLNKMPERIANYTQNVITILAAIRKVYPAGTLVLMKQYSPSADELFILAVENFNQALVGAGALFGAKVADGFTAFQLASARSYGDPCRAGLLTVLAPNTCDVHPSLNGDRVLAAALGYALYGEGLRLDD